MSLSKEKQELLALLLAEEGVEMETAVIPVVADRSQVPLSYQQEQLWFVDQLYPEDPSYNISGKVRLQGELNIPVLRRAFEEILSRHESLRSNFGAREGKPLVIVHEKRELEMPLIDLSSLPERERIEEVSRLFHAETARPFRLADDLLLRTTLIRLEPNDHVLVMVKHHIVTDGWSLGVMVTELGTLYSAYLRGEESPLPPLPIQFGDYAAWQREQMRGGVYEERLQFWREMMKEPLPLQELPCDHPHPPVRTQEGRVCKFPLPSMLIERLTELGAKQEGSLFHVLLAAYDVLLHRYTGQDDLIIGTPVANRHLRETEGLIGFVANVNALRCDLSGDPSFTELVGRIRDTARRAYPHQDMPFMKLVEELRPERDEGNGTLFRTNFVLNRSLIPPLEMPGLTIRVMDLDSVTAKFDLTLYVVEEDGATIGMFEYSTDLFEHETIERMASHYLNLLHSILEHPGMAISELPMLEEEEERKLLGDWSRGEPLRERADEAELCLHELFERQAARAPDRVALVFEGASMTYGELNLRANGVARLLREKGVGSETIVGVCMERSLELLPALLGIMKAGGAYLPLDPQAPGERIRLMLAETESLIVLALESTKARVPKGEHEVIVLDAAACAANGAAAAAAENPGAGVTADGLACVLYTSGSTGKPKGVLVPHRGASNLFAWQREQGLFTEADVVLAHTRYGFDLSVWEMFGALTSGARLVLARPDGQRDMAYLVSLIERERVTWATFVPSMLAVLLEEKEAERMAASLRVVFTAGEALSRDLYERFAHRIGCELHNSYGPTEATIICTHWRCERETMRRAVQIGRPIAGVETYVLDGRMRPVPVGVPGELHVGGACLTRGYLKRPELTENAYVPHPYRAGERLYGTGDIVRILPGGVLEFVGRRDHQVKIRGVRIELGEIEAALTALPDVREAVVLAREEEGGGKDLAAYVVADGADAPDVMKLRSGLEAVLPAYMVPGSYAFVERIPMTVNGKADRAKLLALDVVRARPEVAYVAPGSETEVRLAEMWQELLELERVGVHDHFFHLGGHSLLATQFVGRVRSQLGVELPLSALFKEEPTIAALALRIDALKRTEAGAGRKEGPALVALGRKRRS